jgi:hypothetical protein
MRGTSYQTLRFLLGRQSLDRQSLDRQSLDRQSLDRRSLALAQRHERDHGSLR